MQRHGLVEDSKQLVKHKMTLEKLGAVARDHKGNPSIKAERVYSQNAGSSKPHARRSRVGGSPARHPVEGGGAQRGWGAAA